ncbi:hypothetical protein Rhal01_00190 [Rubritalea halochordaticola]|uniref:Sulfatase-modifying factor enzyme domain-containing protein n=1 Tax=Rubritalea halochordaticola TaxID=714537 RepID=A0ABP9UWG5_9BACT
MTRTTSKPYVILMTFFVLCSMALQAQGPKVSTPTGHRDPFKPTYYPWKKNITATIFWIGEEPTAKNPTPNHASSWDSKWEKSFGGYDNPDRNARSGYHPRAFIPKQNPFYVALPYNDCVNYRMHKPEASRVIPWFRKYNPKPGKSVCKGRWIQIIHGRRICYAQWEDCGPFTTDDWQYVFGNQRPKNKENNGAGIDVSPAVRDYLRLQSGSKVHWRFVDFEHVPQGPWAKVGNNNPFVNARMDRDRIAKMEYMKYLKRMRDEQYKKKDSSGSF